MVGLALFTTVGAHAQTWTTITNRPPGNVTNCLLLTDGGAMCQNGAAFYKLTPSNTGSYLNGTWSTLASFPSGYNPDAYASMVLANGKAVIIGGEYNGGSFALTNMGAVYDSKANTWTMVAPPASTGSPNHWACIGDAPATILADGRFLVGSKLYQDLAILDPNTLMWTELSVSGKNDTFNSEEGWTLLPDGSVFTLDVSKAPAAERLTISGVVGTWVSAGSTSQDLHTPTTSQPLTAPGCPVYDPPGEIGPHLLRPDGTVFAVGASGYTAIYTQPTAAHPTGSFAVGPPLPAGLNVEDGPGALLPSGNVLFGASPGATGTGLQYFEFNGSTLTSVPAPGRASSDATYFTQLLVLPTGQVMFVDGSTTVQLYASSGTPNPSWAPSIGTVPTTINNGSTYQIAGTQFNGLSQATAFGDESQNATNYPLVRITNNATGHVFYARTHDHSTMAVATGATAVTTNFDVPANIEAGASTIQVVANGIASSAVPVTVASLVPAPTIASLAPTSGTASGGTTITITGANFAAGAKVTFGGTAGTAVIVGSATTITVTTPAHTAGLVSVVVTNADGQSATLPNGFTYTTAAPTINSLSPTTGTRNGGTTVTISGNNFASGATVSFGGTAATVRSTSATSISVRTPRHAAGTVNVVVSNPSGLSATLTNGYTFR